jgi:DNA invertase Pin-like site-specific DNA recombinase
MTRAIIYARTATSQEPGGSSALDAQVQSCITYAQEHHYEVVEIICATGSHQLEDLLEKVSIVDPLNILLVTRYDRICRDMTELAIFLGRLQRAGVRVECIEQGFNGEIPPDFFEYILSLEARIMKNRREK